MLRQLRLALVLAIVLTASAGKAHAQYYGGYGPWGWGGWAWGGGDTPQGSIARGLGFYNIGAGVYNLDTAAAASINADTIMRWNQYLWLSQQEANRREYIRLARRENRDSSASEAIYQRIRDHPTESDVANGNALNAILSQLTDPRIHSSALRLAAEPVASDVIKEIPFQNASEGVSLSLNQLTAKDEDWPPALRGNEFAEERQAYQNAIAAALKEDEEGEISQATLANVRAAAARVRAKFEENRPTDPKQLVDAGNYVKALTGMARMLENPQTEEVLGKLKDVPKTRLGSLLGFMHTYNLRFGPATTPKQRAIYTTLYPMLAAERDSLFKELKLDDEKSTASVKTPAKVGAPDFFQGMSLDYLEGKKPEPKK